MEWLPNYVMCLGRKYDEAALAAQRGIRTASDVIKDQLLCSEKEKGYPLFAALEFDMYQHASKRIGGIGCTKQRQCYALQKCQAGLPFSRMSEFVEVRFREEMTKAEKALLGTVQSFAKGLKKGLKSMTQQPEAPNEQMVKLRADLLSYLQEVRPVIEVDMPDLYSRAHKKVSGELEPMAKRPKVEPM